MCEKCDRADEAMKNELPILQAKSNEELLIELEGVAEKLLAHRGQEPTDEDNLNLARFDVMSEIMASRGVDFEKAGDKTKTLTVAINEAERANSMQMFMNMLGLDEQQLRDMLSGELN